MKIAVVGMGVAGSYLMARIKNEHEVVGYEMSQEDNHDSICAWGASKIKMAELCDLAGIDFEKYVYHNGKKMHLKLHGQPGFDVGLKGLCTYNKIGLIKDFLKDTTVHYGIKPKLEDLESEFDIIVDCTGFHRTYLPRIKDDFVIPTYEYKIKYEDGVPFDDFYLSAFPNITGYFWYFPLEDNYAHIGSGDFLKTHVKVTNEFLEKYGGKVVKTVGRPLRLTSSDLCKPFYQGKVVGVGESIGTVFALLGEGIIPSMACVDIFVRNIGNNEKYEKEVLEYFKIYSKVYNFIYLKMHKQFHIIKKIP